MTGKMKKDAKRCNIPYTKFKAYLDENKIKQEIIAKLLNISRTTVNQKLNGTSGDFSMAEVRTLCLHYRISADAYFVIQKVS